MAGAGARLFPENSKLTSAQVNTYLMDQTIMRFATTSARDAAFGGTGEPTLAEGMTCYIDADNTIYTYTGSSWIKMVSASNPPAIELIKTVTFSASTQPSITDVFSSAYDNYRAVITFTDTSTSGTLRIQLRGSSGLSGGSYTTAGVFSYLSGGTQYNDVLGTSNQGVSSGIIGTWGGSNAIVYVTAEFGLPFQAISTNINFHSGGHTPNSGQQYSVGSVIHYSSFSATGFDLFPPSSGNVTGTVRVYGYRNS
jgi:hypothetical protein